MECTDIAPPLYFFITKEAPHLLYYSHIPTSILVFFLGLYVFVKNRNNLAARVFLGMTGLFFLWSISDIVLWVNIDARIILFFWSFINVLESATSALTLYFSYVFLEQKDVPTKFKLMAGILILPLIILIPTHLNLEAFDLYRCEAVQGPLIYYFYLVEIIFSLWLIIYVIRKIWTAPPLERKKIIIFGVAVALFNLFFTWTNIVGSLTQAWDVLIYGFFGVPIFSGLLAYLIVQYQVFNIRLIGAQALVTAMIILVGSQFFFIQNQVNLILTGATLALIVVFGLILIRSVKREIKRKEELQKISDQLAVANEKLQRLDNAKSEFISIASHQLRTPLTAIKGFTSLLLEGAYGKISPVVEDVLNKIYLSNNRLMLLVENLLNISRIESGRIQYQFAEAYIEDLIKELVDTFALAAHQKGLTLNVNLPKTKLPPVVMDVAKIREAVSNLIDNAIKYTPTGGITITVREIPLGVEIAISDTGLGIEAEDLKRLFEKFERGKHSARVNVSSTGLGLYVGKNFVEAHGGVITATSLGGGKGACFTVVLPFNPKNNLVSAKSF